MAQSKKISKKNIEDIAALTPMQEGMLFHYLKDPDSDYYFDQLSLGISGEIDIPLFEKAWNFVIDTNEMLRTVFLWEKVKSPVQMVLKQRELKPAYHDFPVKENHEKETWLEEVKAKDRKEKFHLNDVPFRVTLCKMGKDRYEMIISNHHILYDGWSTGIILREFFKAYGDLSRGKTAKKPVKTKFKEFVGWIQNRDKKEQELFWKDYLAGFETGTGPPVKRKISPGIKGKGYFQIEFSRDLTGELEGFCRDCKTTPASVLYTTWGLLLQKYNNCDDVVFGTTVSGRSAKIKGIENMVGLFINTLPLRVKERDGETIEDLLQRIDDSLKMRERFETSSPADIKKYSESNSKEELFDSIVVIENYPLDGQLMKANNYLSIRSYSMEEMSHYGLALCITLNDCIDMGFSYNRRLFDKETITRLSGYWLNIVKDVIRNPGKVVDKVEILSAEERRKILNEFNDTGREYPWNRTIHELFAGQVRKRPGGTAVEETDSNCFISYEELNEKAHRLAGVLREKGVEPGTIVGIMAEKSIEMILGILGILKTGCAYLPINPDYPGARKKYIIEDTHIGILLSNCRDSDIDVSQIIDLNDPGIYSWEIDFDRMGSRRSLAYIMYTSGSTGYPRGVMVEHKNVVRLVKNSNYVALTAGERMLQTGVLEFDASTFEIWGALLNGLVLCLLGKESLLTPGKLKKATARNRAGTMWMTSPLFNRMVEADIEIFRGIANLLVGGDVLSPTHIGRLRTEFPGINIINGYGPTENTTFSTTCLIDRDFDGSIPIGRPINNSTAYIINKSGLVQPVGVLGELWVGGDGISRGYLNNPELTAEKFASSPFTPHPSPIYKTSDLARWLPDGNIEFLGRMDHQVKIRGYRIEPGEIENRLSNHKDIKEAVVIVKEDGEKEKQLCAYIVSGKDFTVPQLREYLSEELPDYMIPTFFVRLENIPLTSGGKTDRRALASLGTVMETGVEYVSPGSDIEKKVAEIWLDVLGRAGRPAMGIHDNFFDMGGNSFSLIRLNSLLKGAFNKDIPMVALFNYPTVASLAGYLGGEQGRQADRPKEKKSSKPSAGGLEIAVIGMCGRFPGARDIAEFWDNLKNGVESISRLTGEELGQMGVEKALLENPAFVSAKGRLAGIEYFDSLFFGYTLAEAAIMDPQMRIFHECCWAALENAGYDPGAYDGDIGLYAGANANPFWEIMPLKPGTGHGHLDTERWQAIQLSNIDYLSTRIAYKLDLTGPCVTVQTACSTSLTAVILACGGLQSSECDMALAGGVSVSLHDHAGYLYQEGAIMSPDGHCRAFDGRGRGTVGGNGAGVVILKRLEDAVSDGDRIYALIKGSALNNDGKNKAGFTAPGVKGQAGVVQKARQAAGIEPGTIGYIETHGTGTGLGDPIEIEALKQAFNAGNANKKNYCAVGSVKTNIGHLDAAAGIAGFIKTVLALKQRIIPPSLHFERANPGIDFENSPFYVNTVPKEWKSDSHPLRAGVSSFGIGGTNAHVVLEEGPGGPSSNAGRMAHGAGRREYRLILLSAKTEKALDQMTGNLAGHLKENPGIDLADAAYTLQMGRQVFPHRGMLVCKDIPEALDILASPGLNSSGKTGRLKRFHNKIENPFLVFMFPGQGAQYVDMGRELYEKEPFFRREIDRCFGLVKPLMDFDLKEILYPSPSSSSPAAGQDINQTENAQPLLFIFEYALAKLLMRWGIVPRAMTGHSIGEYTAACLAGVFSLEDALKLVVLRGKLMQGMPGGSMLSVPLAEEELSPLLGEELSLAAVNSTAHCVVSGSHEAVKGLAGRLKEKGYNSRLLHTSHAFHSNMMEPILKVFEERAGGVVFSKPGIPYISNVTGRWAGIKEAGAPAYWAGQIRATVRFGDGVNRLLENENAIFLEVGPGRTLGAFIAQHKNKKAGQKVLSLIRHPREKLPDTYYLVHQIGHLWLYGAAIAWGGFYGDEKKHRLRIPLPTYPFEKKRYPLASDLFKWQKQPAAAASGAGKKSGMEKWFYVPVWKPSSLAVPPGRDARGRGLSPPGARWLVFVDDGPLGLQLVEQLNRRRQVVTIVKRGNQFTRLKEEEYAVDPGSDSDYRALIEALHLTGRVPGRVVHSWNVTETTGRVGGAGGTFESADRALEMGFYSLLGLARAIGREGIGTADNSGHRIEIVVLTNRMQAVAGGEVPDPLKAVVRGAVGVIPLEYPGISCRSIDIDYPPPGSAGQGRGQIQPMENLLEMIEREIQMRDDTPGQYAAYRDNQRWIQTFEQMPLETAGQGPPVLKEKGVYLVTGGLGGIGLVLAEYLAKTFKARLILTSRSPFPGREEWDERLLSHDAASETAVKIRKIRELETAGAEVLIGRADAADIRQMQNIAHRAGQRFGSINGIIHAAGLPDGGLIRSRTRDMSETALAPKVRGALVLETLFSGGGSVNKPDFIVLCSSLSSVLPPVGQVAYCAANAFLDSFAFYNTAVNNIYTAAIGWDGWQEVGMAVEAVKKLSIPAGDSPVHPLTIDHPLFTGCHGRGAHREVFVSTLRTDRHWVLDEHRIMGEAVLPGTACLEMVRAAMENRGYSGTLELSAVSFPAPLTVKEGEDKEVRTVIKKEGDDTVFSIISRAKPGEEQWLEHSRGNLRVTPKEEPQRYEIREIEAGFRGKEIIDDPGSETMTVGPRWNCLKRVKFGGHRALGYLELPQAFVSDADVYKLHPALLDVAVGLLHRFQKHKGNYLPFYYKRIRVKNQLPAKIVCFARFAEPGPSREKALAYDITIMDGRGMELVKIEGFTLKKLDMDTVETRSNEQENCSLEISAPGDFDNFVFRRAPRAKPGPGEVEIAVEAAGLNFKEVLLGLGLLGPIEPGLTFGLECAGRISARGEGAEGFAVGDNVIAFGTSCFSPYITAPVKQVAHRPAHLAPAEAATIPVAFMTAYYALITLGGLSRGERVLIHSAAGGVGLAAVKIARWKGAEIFATAGNKEKRSYLRSLGIRQVMNSRTTDFAAEVMKQTGGKGVNMVLNSLSGEFIAKSIALLAPYGRFLEIGIRDMIDNTALGLQPFLNGLSYFSVSLSPGMPGFEEAWREVVRHFNDGTLTPLPHRDFPIDDAAKAFEYMSLGKHTGKIVVTRENREFLSAPGAGDTHPYAAAPMKTPGGGRERFLKNGILPREGVEVFKRVLAAKKWPQVVVSTTDLFERFRESPGLPGGFLPDVLPGAISSIPQHPRPDLSTPYVAPGTEIEQILAQTWGQLLGIEGVGIHDDFFDLGGDSLKAMTLLSKTHKILEVEIPLTEFFNRPTIEKLGRYIRESTSKGKFYTIEAVEEKEYYALSPAQKRMFLLNRLEKESTVYNVFSAVVLEGGLDRERFNRVVGQLIRRHEIFRVSFQVIAGEPVQGIHHEVDFKIEYCEGEYPADFIRPFDLSRAPLLRVGLAEIQRDKHLLMVDMHHIISDGFSQEILIRDFAALYTGRELAKLSLRYRDFSGWQAREKRKGSLDKQEEYWLKQLEGQIPLLGMPTDFPRPGVHCFEGGTITLSADKELTARLAKLISEAGATPHIVLLAVFYILLFKYTEQEDIIVGSPIAGRTHPDLENIIGMFVNMLVLRAHPRENNTFRQLLQEVKENALSAYENQDYPFEELVKKLALQREPGRHPLVDAVFLYRDMELPGLEIPGLTLTPHEFEQNIAHFDLLLTASEVELKLEYSSALFNLATAERILKQYIEILRQVTVNQDIMLKEISVSHDLLSAASSILQDDKDFGF